ncbi:MAG: EAL domain-containing protein [Wenzhouxiangella sp.]|nr:MAG: EAL domain-containing protein [Wenzhouxiangella sp.]
MSNLHIMLNFLLVSTLGLVIFAAIVLFYHHYIWNRLSSARTEQWMLGALMGLGTVLAMLLAVDVSNGLLLDARVLLMGFAGLLAGWPGALAAMMISIPARLLMGGEGGFIGSLTLMLAPLVGLIWRRIQQDLNWQPGWRFLVFGVLLSFALATIFLFPEPQRSQALQQALPLLIGLNVVGSLLAGWMQLGINQNVVRTERLRRRALRDDLTGLGNRLLLTESIESNLAQPNGEKGSFALVSIDLDNFRHINDTLGHKVGDAVLVEMSKRLNQAIGPDDLLVRVAGDQFAVRLASASANDVIERAQELLMVARQPLQLEQYVLLMTASIGVVWWPKDGTEAKELLQNAEIAMYQSKRAGRNQVTRFDDNMRTALERQTQLTQALLQALEHGHGLQLAFQPQFRLSDSQLIGAEVLLRWTHPELGPVSPAEFVPLAEQAGLARLLDQFVVKQVAIQQAAWIRAGHQLALSINVSVLSLKAKGTADELLAVLDGQGVSPNLIKIEVTESVDLEGSNEALAALRRLRAAGINIALDDFGTGHSSLSYLQDLPLDIVKIDRSFVTKIEQDNLSANSVLVAILALAKALDLLVVAEGVETQVQRDWLVAAGSAADHG